MQYSAILLQTKAEYSREKHFSTFNLNIKYHDVRQHKKQKKIKTHHLSCVYLVPGTRYQDPKNYATVVQNFNINTRLLSSM
jgi:hypothetical protein